MGERIGKRWREGGCVGRGKGGRRGKGKGWGGNGREIGWEWKLTGVVVGVGAS